VPVNLWAFAAVTVPLVATPGASTAVVLRNSIAGGVRAGIATAIGVNGGSIAYGLLTAFGVSAALQQWPVIWLLLRAGGVLYLGWLGVRSLMRAFTREWVAAAGPASPAPVSARPALARRAGEGFLTNALNPSIATFYLLVVPQFIPRQAPFGRSALLLTATHVSLALSWHLVWATAGGTLAGVLGRSRPRRILEGVAGAALLLLAIALIR
jgi:threonine/homoserine/homoserine lactone efflux protein